MSESDPLHKYETIRQAFRVFHLLWVNLYFITYTNSRFNDIWSLWIEIHPLMVRRTSKLRNRITPDHAKRGMEKCKPEPLVDIPPTLAAVRRICWSIYYFWKFLCWGTAYYPWPIHRPGPIFRLVTPCHSPKKARIQTQHGSSSTCFDRFVVIAFAS